MGRKAKWLIAIKKVFSPESKEKGSHKSKKRRGSKSENSDPCLPEPVENIAPGAAGAASATPPPPYIPSLPPVEDFNSGDIENEQNKHAYSVAIATAVAAEAAVVAAQAAAEVVRLTSSARVSGRSREEIAAIKIQTAFRGYQARKALRALRGLVRLKSLIQGNAVKRQATTTLRCMQTLARVQSQIHSRRIRMSEENQALQRQLLLKRERELEKLRLGDEWDDSIQSKEQIEASFASKQEATIRRERALAYAFSHQWKSSSRSANPMFMDPNNPQWGWSWLERWMAARPWESRTSADKELNSDLASVKSTIRGIARGEISKAYARRDTSSEKPSPVPKSSPPPSRQSPVTPPSKKSSANRKTKQASPRESWAPTEDDMRSMVSLQSERPRRHSIAGSSVRDDESLASSTAVPSYMALTASVKARSRLQSPSSDKVLETPEKVSVSSVKKRLTFPASEKSGVSSLARVRRHSGPPKVDLASLSEQKVSNGGSRQPA